jgi:hypothetical protein
MTIVMQASRHDRHRVIPSSKATSDWDCAAYDLFGMRIILL